MAANRRRRGVSTREKRRHAPNVEEDITSTSDIEEETLMPKQQLSKTDRGYLVASNRGDIPTVRRALENNASGIVPLNINCTDALGRNALRIAVENDNIELLELLLQFNIEIKDGLLHAINEENVEAVDLLLRVAPTNRKDLRGKFGEQTVSDSFTSDITPLILAAQRDNYEIISLLWKSGERMTQPHDVTCTCGDCAQAHKEDSLGVSRSRINTYRALASPGLICLASADPLIYAFELSYTLRRLSKHENEFKREYEELDEQCRDFAVAILNETRDSAELNALLSQSTTPSAERDHWHLPRLQMALRYEQRKFVAHPNCQQLLASLWYKGIPGFRRWTTGGQAGFLGAVCFFYPFLSIGYLLAPQSSLGKFVRQPFVKFICHSASNITFLLLLILASQGISPRILGSAKTDLDRAPLPDAIELAVVAWVFGFIWSEMKTIYEIGLEEYLHDLWNLLDFATNCLYLAVIGIRVTAYFRIRMMDEEVRNETRANWHWLDPVLVSECFFAGANVISQLKIVQIFTINPHLGPLQISLGRMIVDIIKFGIIFFLVVISFTCGLSHIYRAYAEARLEEEALQVAQNVTVVPWNNGKWRRFGNWFEILQTLYWALFGLVDLDSTELKEEHPFTNIVGKLMFGSYSYIAVIVLINMLIAMMTNSYQRIEDDSDLEWKFARSRLWMSYFDKGNVVPPPFNLLPSMNIIRRLVRLIDKGLCRCTKSQRDSKWKSVRKAMESRINREDTYRKLMNNLKTRYLLSRQRNEQREGVTEDDTNEIKQDISSFRYQLLEILRTNGMKWEEKLVNKGAEDRPTTETSKRLIRRNSGYKLALLSQTASPDKQSDSLRRRMKSGDGSDIEEGNEGCEELSHRTTPISEDDKAADADSEKDVTP